MNNDVLSKAMAQILIESAQQYYKMIREEKKQEPAQETAAVEIDIGCRKNTQAAKIYALLVLADKLPWPDSQIVQHGLNELLEFAGPELKKDLLDLANKNNAYHLTYEDKKLSEVFPGLKQTAEKDKVKQTKK